MVILEKCISKQKKEKNLINNTIHFGEKNLLGEYILDARYAQMPLENVQIFQHLIHGEEDLQKVRTKDLMQQLLELKKGQNY